MTVTSLFLHRQIAGDVGADLPRAADDRLSLEVRLDVTAMTKRP